MFIIVDGNPLDGFSFVGPFESYDGAEDFLVSHFAGTSVWIANLHAPTEEDAE